MCVLSIFGIYLQTPHTKTTDINRRVCRPDFVQEQYSITLSYVRSTCIRIYTVALLLLLSSTRAQGGSNDPRCSSAGTHSLLAMHAARDPPPSATNRPHRPGQLCFLSRHHGLLLAQRRLAVELVRVALRLHVGEHGVLEVLDLCGRRVEPAICSTSSSNRIAAAAAAAEETRVRE